MQKILSISCLCFHQGRTGLTGIWAMSGGMGPLSKKMGRWAG